MEITAYLATGAILTARTDDDFLSDYHCQGAVVSYDNDEGCVKIARVVPRSNSDYVWHVKRLWYSFSPEMYEVMRAWPEPGQTHAQFFTELLDAVTVNGKVVWEKYGVGDSIMWSEEKRDELQKRYGDY